MSQFSSSALPPPMMIDDEPKTSLAAILGFLVSLVGCCLPTGMLGVVLGVFGLLGISRSGGRVGGKGLAIAAIIIGALNTMIWIGLVSGAMFFGRQMNHAGSDLGTVLTSIDDGNYDAARGLIVGPLSNATDGELMAFGEAVHAEFGTFSSVPTSIGDLFMGYASVGPAMQKYQGQRDLIPIPARFDSGQVLLIYATDSTRTSGKGSGFGAPLMDIYVIGLDGTEVKLSDFVGTSPPLDTLETRVTIRAYETLLEHYLADQGAYPALLNDLVTEGYIEDTEMTDGWDHPFFYQVSPDRTPGYKLISAGADGELDTADDMNLFSVFPEYRGSNPTESAEDPGTADDGP